MIHVAHVKGHLAIGQIGSDVGSLGLDLASRRVLFVLLIVSISASNVFIYLYIIKISSRNK